MRLLATLIVRTATKNRAFSLFQLGHGGPNSIGEDCLLDVNSGFVSIRNEFIKRVRNRKMPKNFRGRPRIFFIQVRRGWGCLLPIIIQT